MTDLNAEATGYLSRHVEGNKEAANQLMGLVYDQLLARARQLMRRERKDHTLSPTAVVHETYLRLIDSSKVDWNGRAHFFALAARTMRRVLVDHQRGRDSQKRRHDRTWIALDHVVDWKSAHPVNVLAFDEALEKLARLSPRQSQVLELQFFGGLGTDEIAHVLGVSEAAVRADRSVAKAWVLRELDADERPS
jgi:RNA polymerase sigma factor (TIGR02999 family)